MRQQAELVARRLQWHSASELQYPQAACLAPREGTSFPPILNYGGSMAAVSGQKQQANILLLGATAAERNSYCEMLQCTEWRIQAVNPGLAVDPLHDCGPVDCLVVVCDLHSNAHYAVLERVYDMPLMQQPAVVIVTATAENERRLCDCLQGVHHTFIHRQSLTAEGLRFRVRQVLHATALLRGESSATFDGKVASSLLLDALPSSRQLQDFGISIFENCVDCVKLLDLDGRLQAMNKNGLALLELDEFAPLRGVLWETLWPGKAVPEVRAAVDLARRGGVGRFEAECPTGKGNVRWWDVIVTPMFGEKETPVALISISRDISQQRASKLALQESEDRFHDLADNIAQLAWMADHDGNVFWYNKRWFDFTGTTLDQMHGWGWQAVHHPTHLEHVMAGYRHSLDTGEPWEDTFPLRASDGTYRWFLSRALPVRDANGELIRWFGTNTDITELREAQDALRNADRRKDEFLGMLAHELKNPLAPLRNATEILRRNTSLDTRAREVRVIIERQVSHLAHIVDDLLDAARVIDGNITLQREHHRVADLFAAAIAMVQPNLAEKEQHLVLDLPEQPLWLEGDGARLIQAFSNLLNNAVKYSSTGGSITLSAKTEDQQILVCVKDNGMGMDKELRAHVFDLFTQGDRSLDRTGGGLGIGLSLVRGIVLLHGGTVSAHSDGPGAGSEFNVRLQLLPAGDYTKERAPVGDRTMQTRRILIVDDSEDAAETMAILLGMDGHETRMAYDGPTALSLVHDFKPDVLILDIGLPDMDGYQLATALRTLPVTANALLIALTGYGQIEHVQRSASAGFNHHLVKPVDPDRLRELLA